MHEKNLLSGVVLGEISVEKIGRYSETLPKQLFSETLLKKSLWDFLNESLENFVKQTMKEIYRQSFAYFSVYREGIPGKNF